MSPRWVWPAVALLAMLGSAVIWFGEGWHTAWRFGFDLSDRYTRRELYNYADRDSVFRINPMAGWLQWPSAKLAALGRNHDHPWIEALDDAYSENEGTHNRPLIRRYSIQDGQHLSTHPLPDRSQMQNKRGRGGAYLGEFNGIVFVSNGDQYYSLRYGHTDPWVTFPSETPDAHRSVLSISLDGQYLIVGLSDSSSSYYRVADTKQLVVIDTDSGKAIATLDLLDSLQDAPPPTTTSASSDNPTVRVVLEDWHDLGGIAIVEDQPQILLYLRPKLIGTHTTRILHWDFSQHTLTDGDILAPHPLPLDQVLIGPYSWSIQSINHYDDRLADYNALFELLSREQRFQYWVKHERLIGRTVGWLPSDTYVRVQSLHNPDEPAPYDRYDPLTSIPLYKLATTTSHTRPDRVLEFSHPHGRESASIILSPTGRLGVVRFGYNGPKLAVDVENVQALGHLGLSVNGNDLILFSEFANDERRLVIWSAHSNPASSSRYQSDVDEIRIFDLPE